MVGASYTYDRFGNPNSAVYVFGNQFSYINLGNQKVLKPNVGSLSLWVNVEKAVWSGKGFKANPIIVAKRNSDDDFFESYGIYYEYLSKKIAVCSVRDSLRQINITSMEDFELAKWQHLVFTYDDHFLSFYINGKLEKKIVKNFPTLFDSQLPLLLGVTANAKNDRFTQGAFDDIAIYDKVLNAAEVLDLYKAPNPNKYKIIFNWLLICLAILLIITLTYLYVKRRLSQALKKEKQLFQFSSTLLENELRVNRSLMNPHFIFNSLNTLHSLILKNEVDKANHYLIRFSKLTRKILENNASNTVLLSMEIQLLLGYVELESLRFEKDILYSIDVIPPLSPSNVSIPTMMLQPFVENAIWHGLLKKEGEKFLSISFSLHEGNYLLCIIEDNGVGRNPEANDNSQKKSMSTLFVSQRLDLLNKIHKLECQLSIEDKPNRSGTRVKIILPLLNN